MTLSTKMSYIGVKYHNYGRKNPLVLNIELTHLCNLECTYCGRIRDNVKGKLTEKDARSAIKLTPAPIVYFTGGEPFIYWKELEALINYALQLGRVVIVVTNGILVPKYLGQMSIPNKEHVVLMFSVDGLEKSHDLVRGSGNFKRMLEGIQVAKSLGYHHRWINFTLYPSNADEMEEVVSTFSKLCEQVHLNLGYDFLGNLKISGQTIEEVSKRAKQLKRKYRRIFNSYLYFDFWAGKQDLDCTPWATVTRDSAGWRGPCYFIEQDHFSSYEDLMNKTKWEPFIKHTDPRCSGCKAHCGFEPTIYANKMLLLKELTLQLKSVI